MASYHKGALVRVSATFVSKSSGAAVDPTTVTFAYKNPAGATTNWTVTANQIVKDSVGNYHADIDASSTGNWYWRFVGTGTNQGAKEGTFEAVSPGGF